MQVASCRKAFQGAVPVVNVVADVGMDGGMDVVVVVVGRRRSSRAI